MSKFSHGLSRIAEAGTADRCKDGDHIWMGSDEDPSVICKICGLIMLNKPVDNCDDSGEKG